MILCDMRVELNCKRLLKLAPTYAFPLERLVCRTRSEQILFSGSARDGLQDYPFLHLSPRSAIRYQQVLRGERSRLPNSTQLMQGIQDLLESHVDFESADQFFLLSSTDELFSELKAQLKIRTSPKRTAFTIPFVLAKGLEISIQGYTLINETKKVAAVQVDTSAREIAEVKQVTEYGDAVSSLYSCGSRLSDLQQQGRPLDVKHIKPYFPVGQKASKQEKVVFEKDDITTLKTLGMKPCRSGLVWHAG